jgi:ornithine decarboxylase
MERFDDAFTAIAAVRPENSLFVFRPASLKKAADFFLNKFQGTVLYAVKTNPEPHILKALHQHGVRNFDVASLAEVELARKLFPDATLHFMHTVKSRHAIREAYFTHGVRHFSLDCEDELAKILQETKNAADLSLYVRLAIPNTYAELNLAGKFGITAVDAIPLLQQTRKVAAQLGVCFHVGSQCMHPDAYRIAIQMAKKTVRDAGVSIDKLDVGGGFPSIYPGMHPPAMQEFFDVIHEEFLDFPNHENIQLMCEPGRALVAESGSVIVRVELRKDEQLYINDGTYGSLFDAGIPNFVFPVRLLRQSNAQHATLPFSFFGPTCDTMDFMKGPFYLPEDTEEGDYIEVGQLGAYGRTFNTYFNGFAPEKKSVIIDDEPLMTMYDEDAE